MKKIGIIDYYLDNWHASHLPAWLKEETNDEYKICYAWGKISPKTIPNSTVEQSLSSEDWCAAYGVELCANAAEVVAKSDVLMVLSPNNQEQHEELCQEALRSGKKTYIDKTFAPDCDTAIRLIRLAETSNTPMFSSSALRFSDEIQTAKNDTSKDSIKLLNVKGPGAFSNYSIHQIEMIVALMGTDAKCLMAIGDKSSPGLLIEFEGNVFATMGHFGWNCPFTVSGAYKDGSFLNIKECSNYFPNFIKKLIEFFETGVSPVNPAETVAVAKIIENGKLALEKPAEWIQL